jgi:hypothetical protein
MKFLRTVTFEEIQQYLNTHHPVSSKENHAGNIWAHQMANRVGEQAGKWSLVELDPEDTQRIILPWHVAEDVADAAETEEELVELLKEKPDAQIIDRKGSAVRDVIGGLQQNPDYREEYPRCWGKILYWKDHAPLPLLLSGFLPESPRHSLLNIENNSHPTYHIDGLHRLVAQEFYNKKDILTAYIAEL